MTVMIKTTWRKLADLCSQSSGISFQLPSGRVITNVRHGRTPTGRRRLGTYEVSMADGWGFWVERADFDSPVEIVD